MNSDGLNSSTSLTTNPCNLEQGINHSEPCCLLCEMDPSRVMELPYSLEAHSEVGGTRSGSPRKTGTAPPCLLPSLQP